jgi:hypothetical protein
MDQFLEVGPVCYTSKWAYVLVIFVILWNLFVFLTFGTAGIWPHAYFVHDISPEGENRVQSTTNLNHHQSLHGSPVAVEMTTDTSQALDSMEAGGRIR